MSCDPNIYQNCPSDDSFRYGQRKYACQPHSECALILASNSTFPTAPESKVDGRCCTHISNTTNNNTVASCIQRSAECANETKKIFYSVMCNMDVNMPSIAHLTVHSSQTSLQIQNNCIVVYIVH